MATTAEITALLIGGTTNVVLVGGTLTALGVAALWGFSDEEGWRNSSNSYAWHIGIKCAAPLGGLYYLNTQFQQYKSEARHGERADALGFKSETTTRRNCWQSTCHFFNCMSSSFAQPAATAHAVLRAQRSASLL